MTRLERIQEKIITCDKLDQNLAYYRFLNSKIVFTNGCFDILHPGHIEYLYKAAEFGHILVIGLNTDNSVKRLKGEKRPLQDENARAVVLAGLGCVDMVVLFEEDTPLNLINKIQPDVLVKGGDYKIEDIVGYSEVLSFGGEVISIPFVDGFSSTNILNKI